MHRGVFPENTKAAAAPGFPENGGAAAFNLSGFPENVNRTPGHFPV
jgi:hypothetical protein